MLSTLLAVVTIDRLGRRVGLWWGAVVQGASLFLAGGFSKLLRENPAKSSQYGGAAAFFVFLYTATFGATWLTIPWVYPTETFPLYVRAKGNAWGVVGWSIGVFSIHTATRASALTYAFPQATGGLRCSTPSCSTRSRRTRCTSSVR